MTCPACGVPVPDGARFCPECGQRLVLAPDERRLVTVVMADLVGYTAFSADTDPEQVKRLVDDAFEHLLRDVTAFGGRLDKIVGDELVAVFGTPIAHEDDAERAVRAALAMQTTLADLAPRLGDAARIRIGVNSGEVLVGAIRAGGDSTVTGDVVNTAQRLQKLAEPGHVVVGPATFMATRESIQYEELGPQGLPGREEPVDAYRAIEPLTPPGRRRMRDRARLVGRDVEMGALANAVTLAVKRRRAQLVLLTGDAGVGKSRLAQEVSARAAREHGAMVFGGQCVPYGDANAFGPIAEALREATGAEGGFAPGESGHRRLVECVCMLLGLAPEAAETERHVEGLTFVIEGTTRPGVDPSRARDDALRSAFALLEALAAAKPIVLVLSDLHWANDEVLEFSDRLLARLHSLPFVLVATARPGFETRWSPDPGRHNALVLRVDPLDDDATAELVRELLCGEADEETVGFLLDRSGGNPFFVEELTAFVQDTRDGEALTELPATLHGLVAARLDALAAGERSLLEDCAVVGSSGPISTVLSLAVQPDARLLLDRLAERDLLHVDNEEFRFKSELIREVAYGRLTKAERARRHAAIAPALASRGEPHVDQLAHHLATAAELVGEIGSVPGVPDDVRAQAIDALVRAAERDESVEVWLAAERHHDRILGLLTDGDDTAARRRALLGRGRARIQQHALDDARADVLTVLSDARADGDRYSEAFALTLLGESEAASGAYEVAEATFGDALDVWRELHDDSGAANVLRGLGMTHLFRGNLPDAERFVSEALGSYRAIGNPRGSAWALQNLAWISFNHGNITQAEKRLEESAELFGELGDWGGLGWAYGLLAFVRYNQGRLEEAAAIAEHIALEGRETGNRWAVGMMDVLQANVALWTGHTHDAIERGGDAITLFRDIGDRWGEVMATASVMRALAELGRDGEYEALLETYFDIARSLPDEGMRYFPHLLSAMIELQRGNPEPALALAEQVPADEEDTLGQSDVEAVRAFALVQLGRVDEGLPILERVYERSDDDGPAMAFGSRLALAYAAAQRPDDALDVVLALHSRAGGTYSDRIFALWAESLARAQRGDGDARASIDAAHAIAITTDAPLEHAIAALARAYVLSALGDDDAAAVRDDATRQLTALGIDAHGWSCLFERALADVVIPR
jgi:class 3 adenylate cyclase/tetratricopeptide (TPR) repeat protein